MKFTAIFMTIAAVQAVRFDSETEAALSKQKNKWFEDEIHDDEYSEHDIEAVSQDAKNVQLSYSGANEARMNANSLGLAQGFEDEIDDVNVQIGQQSNNNRIMFNLAKKYGTI